MAYHFERYQHPAGEAGAARSVWRHKRVVLWRIGILMMKWPWRAGG